MKKKVVSFLKKYALFIGLTILSFIVTLYFIIPTFSENVTSSIWDGSVATSFSTGTGTLSDPYLINDGAELAYFFNSFNDNSEFYNKNFELRNNIDLNNYDFSNTNNNINYFSGTFNGNGYTISNFTINNPKTSNLDYDEYSIFSELLNANIKNINFMNVNVNISSITKTTYVSLVSAKSQNTTFSNISVSNFNVNIQNISDEVDYYVSSIIANDLGNNTLNNIHIDLECNVAATNLIANYTNSSIQNIILKNNDFDILDNDGTFNVDTIFIYNIVNNNIIFDNNYSTKSILDLLNETSSFTWSISDNVFKLRTNEIVLPSNNILTNLETHVSGVESNIVYVNDLENDLNYFYGKNFTDSDNAVLPTMINKHIYTENNLVKVQINYNGSNINNTLTGTVSLTETQNKYIYVKAYEINDNNTSNDFTDDFVRIELIDNPFTNRPNNMAFNGWISSNQNIEFSFDKDYYLRYITIPISYTDSKPDNLIIDLYASWITANVSDMTGNWDVTFSSLKKPGMTKLGAGYYDIEDISSLFVPESVNWYEYYPANAYNSSGNNVSGYCRSWFGCDYYRYVGSDPYNSNQTYYKLQNNRMRSYIPQNIYYADDYLPENTLLAGYYRLVNIPLNGNLVGFYDELGNYQKSGTCNSSGGCAYYELIQYYNQNGNVELSNGTDTYYYLTTRDTNIIVLKSNISTIWSSTKPFTLTGIHNGQSFTNYYFNVNNTPVYCYNDTTIENLYIYSTGGFQDGINVKLTSSNSTSKYFYGNYYNVKIGRGIINNTNSVNFFAVLGGNNYGSGENSNLAKYRFIVESGFYNLGTLLSGSADNNITNYVSAFAQYGNDYDKVVNNNDNLVFYSCLATSWGGRNYTSNETSFITTSVYKSGNYGASQSGNTIGIYIVQRESGTNYGVAKGIIEGGNFYVVNGGPQVDLNRTTLNSLLLYIKGGTIVTLFGGAGSVATAGNRIIQMTGGTIRNSLFGGSNAYNGGEGTGSLNGNSYIYIGGNAQVGVENGPNLWGTPSGCVYAHGDGASGRTTVGSNNNSYVIIDGNAHILGNVFGGANLGRAGSTSTTGLTESLINILGGIIDGSVYAGGNQNGVGTTSILATNTINMYNGLVKGSIYGGSKSSGTLHGSSLINIYGGTIKTDVYGGGEGGYTDSNNGTFISDNVTINIGTSTSSPIIEGSVYGGSAYGSVNAEKYNDGANSKTVTINVVNGDITNSVFGGAKGNNSITPYVKGNIIINISGGIIGSVYGGFDQSGTPQGTSEINLTGGIIGSVYGGGNKTSINQTNVNLLGSTLNYLFGGSNQDGIVGTSNVLVSSGSVGTIFGGNNYAGQTNNSVITLTGGTVTGEIYGGGDIASTTNSTINLNSYNGNLSTVYGGGRNASVDYSTINLESVTVTNIYGGSNILGNVMESTINLNSGIAQNVYGGNNSGGEINQTNIIVNGGIYENIYGGGERISSEETNVTINNGMVGNLYGGGNMAGVTSSFIDLKNGAVGAVYGGSNQTGDVNESLVKSSENSNENNDVGYNISYTANATTWESDIYPFIIDINVTITNNSLIDLSKYTGSLYILDSELFRNDSNTYIINSNNVYGFTETNHYYGINNIAPGNSNSFSFKILSMNETLDYDFNFYSEIGIINKSLAVGNVFGGNNAGGVTENANLDLNGGFLSYVYGGGNETPTTDTNVNIVDGLFNNVYAGANASSVTNNTILKISGGIFLENVYGGGNEGVVNGNTNVNINAGVVSGSVYAGGNGLTAIVNGNTNINISGSTIIGEPGCLIAKNCSVYGGGNAAATGLTSTNNSIANVNIVGGTIYGNVYGGANTSVVNGYTNVFVGNDVVLNEEMHKSNIIIYGTIFGGSESSAENSDKFSWRFPSVTKGILVKVNGYEYNIDIKGSIFGSGNYSSSSGTSEIDIYNYGTLSDPQTIISLQRTKKLVVDNSSLILKGAIDKTLLFSTTLFTLSIIDELDLQNNSTLYLEKGANSLSSFKSLDANGNLETVSIDAENQTVTKNTDNSLFMLLGNKTLNIASDEDANTHGEVFGMTYFGMYKYNADNSINYGIYDKNKAYGDQLNWLDVFLDGSYISGLHKVDHDITIDGFYSNFIDETDATNKINFIEATPPNTTFYRWIIGETVVEYPVNLVASKYSTLGATEFTLDDFYEANTSFEILDFDYSGLDESITLVDPSTIPRIASSGQDADTIMGLSIKSSNVGLLTDGTTNFYTDENNLFDGTEIYVGDNTNVVPSMLFYLYHSKNLETENLDLGTVKIVIMAVTKINDITNKTKRLIINVNLSRWLVSDNAYEASITEGREYELFTTTATNITSKSSFSTYFSLYADENFVYREGYHRSLVSSYVLPENTKVTMIDISDSLPKYYYHIINQQDVNNAIQEYQTYGEISYNLSLFEEMGADGDNINYNDEIMNNLYYNTNENVGVEEFIFIFDFEDTNITQTSLNNSILMELKDGNNQTIISVLSSQHQKMIYSLYSDNDAVINIDGSASKNTIYNGETFLVDLNTIYTENSILSNKIYDTKYFDSKLGIKISLINSSGEVVSGTSLMGLYYTINGVNYYPNLDGTTRVKIADRVGNVKTWLRVNSKNANIATGNYNLRVESFGSPDGIYYGLYSSDQVDIPLYIINEIYGLNVVETNKSNLILSKAKENQSIEFNLDYNSGLANPSIHMRLYRRNYNSVYDTSFSLVDLDEYLSSSVMATNKNKEYLVVSNPNAQNSLNLIFENSLLTGTYRLDFVLCDNDQEIGIVEKYIIIK